MNHTLKTLRHSAAELLAISIASLFPKVQLVNGEATDLGFYYDFFFPEPITKEQFSFIEERMGDFIRQNLAFRSVEMMRKNAIELFKHHRQDLKVALLKENVETLVHICQLGSFYDLAYPPFLESTKQIGAVKLLDISHLNVSLPGRPHLTLTRIHGTAFFNNQDLRQFLKKTEEAKKRDHRLIGQDMGLFMPLEEACPGCWAWSSKGTILRDLLINYGLQEYKQHKCFVVKTPALVKPQFALKESFYLQFEPQGPRYSFLHTKASAHAALYKATPHALQELPIRSCEFAEFYDQGREVHLWGLLRSRSFTGDCAYTFCTQEQVSTELISSLQFINKTIKIMGFEAQWRLLAKSRKLKGALKKWDESQASLVKALEVVGFDYTLDNEEKELYGPTIEVYFIDALGREWKGPYLYMDLYHPEKFGLSYQGAGHRMHTPVMIGWSIYGSIERLTAILVEHYAGELPLWLAPEQVRVIPVTDKNAHYASQLYQKIESAGFRTSIDDRKENLNVKVRKAVNEKVPYTLVLGDQEENNKTISLRTFREEGVQDGIELEKFLELLNSEVKAKLKMRNKP